MNSLKNFFSGNKQEDTSLEDKTLSINKNRCPQNHACPSVRVCPVGALSQSGYSAPKVDMKKCIKCGKCVRSCPMRAINLA